ncbi:MAG: hypothetical protein PHV30_03580 [Candidatus Margulisbacteria bacterium]|nr:hypothetical protein [Candidatus Margulisiibacteriota bacterium]
MNNKVVNVKEKVREFSADKIKLNINGSLLSVADIMKMANGKTILIDAIDNVITELNGGYQFSKEIAEDWVNRLLLLTKVGQEVMADPYAMLKDTARYAPPQFFTQDKLEEYKNNSDVIVLDTMPNVALKDPSPAENKIMKHTLRIIPAGGVDSTFYKGLNKEEKAQLMEMLYDKELVDVFGKYDAKDYIIRSFASINDKTEKKNVSIIESLIVNSYKNGIRNIALYGNGMSYQPIKEYLDKKFGHIKDLNIVVIPQPLLPKMKKVDNEVIISAANGGYPGGHGHGLKSCLAHEEIQSLIKENDLTNFYFSNADNIPADSWGAGHIAKVINNLDDKDMAFFFVWELLRKGGFGGEIQDKLLNVLYNQVIEVELAGKCGVDLSKFADSKGGYNTNVAAGNLEKTGETFKDMPMALKQKGNEYMFEASLGTAATTKQDHKTGEPSLQKNTKSVLGPKEAAFQHWMHIAIRARGDLLFALMSNLVKVVKIDTEYGPLYTLTMNRKGDMPFPILKGEIADKANTFEFVRAFINAHVDVSEFTGTIEINGNPKDVTFTGNIKFIGGIDSKITFNFNRTGGVNGGIFDMTEKKNAEYTFN